MDDSSIIIANESDEDTSNFQPAPRQQDSQSKRGGDDGKEEQQVKRPRSCCTTQTPSLPLRLEEASTSEWVLQRQLVEVNSSSSSSSMHPPGVDNNSTSTSTSTSMILREHLGNPSAMVESLTHQLDSWSLISRKSIVNTKKDPRKKQAVLASKRAVMKAVWLAPAEDDDDGNNNHSL